VSETDTANAMPFSPHSILQVIVRLFVPVLTKISENLGGSEYDILEFSPGASSLDVRILRFFRLCYGVRLHHLKFEVKLLPTKNR
jgi:hypothetical protein